MKTIVAVILFGLLVFPPLRSLNGEGGAPFSISIRPQHERIQAGSDVLLDVAVTNTSGHVFTMTEFSPELIYALDVKAPDGTEAEMTDAGRKVVKDAHIWMENKNFLEVTLLPRQTVKEVIKIDDKVQMWTPGIYSVKLRRKIPADLGQGEVESNSVEITITYNPAVEKYAIPAVPKER